MANEKNPETGREKIEPGSEDTRERVQALLRKTAGLNLALTRVEEDLKEASGTVSSSGRPD